MPNETHDPGDGYAELLGDALSETSIELDVLLRYDREPEAMEPEERARVEAYLAESPAHRDRLKVMARLAAAQRAGNLEGALATPPARDEAGAEVIPLRRAEVWRPLALAASVLLALAIGFGVYSQLQRDTRDAGAPIASQDPEAPSDALVPEERRSEQVAQQAEPIEDEPPAEPALPEAQLAERTTPELETPPAGEETPAPESTRVAEVPPPPSSEAPTPAPQADPEPIQIAALLAAGPIDYLGVAGLEEVVRVDGVSRAADAPSVAVHALAPEHIGLTTQASPVLYWSLSETTDAAQELVVMAWDRFEPLLRIERPSGAATAGIHRIDLAEHGVELVPGTDYRWTLSVIVDPDRRDRDAVASAGVRRVPADAALTQALADAPAAQRAHVLASRGVWYDALDFLSKQIEAHPTESGLRGLRERLLAGAGLAEATRTR